jgi:hypothetical protein
LGLKILEKANILNIQFNASQVKGYPPMNSLRYVLLLMCFGITAAMAAEPRLASFGEAKAAFEEHSGCVIQSILAPSYDHGELANCVLGESRSIVYELEKNSSGDGVKKAKITWFDFAAEPAVAAQRYRPHADRGDAERSLAAFADAYAPCQKERLQDSFFNGAACQCHSADGKFAISVYQFDNPSLTERSVEIRAH